ncbi:MAG: F0F1 ATP synthase subunit gamma [Candidatus Aminicenantes bacterium]|jgi:F-type H+-transporting ATPase subunit gamma
MEQLETLRRKIESAEDLHSVVKTMKTLAAVNIREYERAVESLNAYNQTIEMGLQILMRHRKKGTLKSEKDYGDHIGAVIFGSEQGMVGQFNDQIVSFSIQRMEELQISKQNRHVLAIGKRVTNRLEDSGQSVEDHVSLFESMMDLTSVNQEILIKIEEWRLEKDIDQIIIFYNRPASKAAYQPALKKLLPLDLKWLQNLEKKEWPTRVLPLFSMEWDRLFSSLIRQYFFVSLYRATVESLASENSSRLASMHVAEKNIGERLEEFNTQYQHRRQETITAELLDIVSGFEVLSG